MDLNGYLVSLKGKEKFIGDCAIYRNLFIEKYIHSIKNMMALYYIVTLCFEKNMYEDIQKSIIDMIQFFKENEGRRHKFERALYYLPVFACEYYVYANNISDGRQLPEEIVELYKSFKLSGKEREQYYRILNRFIYDACRCRETRCDKTTLKEGDVSGCDDYIKSSGYWQALLK